MSSMPKKGLRTETHKAVAEGILSPY